MRLKDYVAEIRCDDVVLEEYGTKMEADGKTLSCWIPSEAGKTFSISWKFNRDDASNASQGLTYVDGTVIGKATRAGNKASKIATHSGVDIDDASFRPFTFAPIPLTDEPDLALARRDLDALGTISVVIFRAVPCVASRNSPNKVKKNATWLPNLNDTPVHEKDKKLGGHCVRLGPAVTREGSLKKSQVTTGHSWQRTGPSLVTFRFLYRSKDFLQAQEIIPNTSDAPHISSSPSQTIRKSRRLQVSQNAIAGPSNTNHNQFEPESAIHVKDLPTKDEPDEAEMELYALQRQLEETQKRIKQIKRKRQPSNQLTGPTIKTEKRIKNESPIGQKANLNYSGDVIDLTSD